MKPSRDFVRRVNTINKTTWGDHRSGWCYVMSLLESYQHQDGILLDGCVDETFGYGLQHKKVVYEDRWVGFLHHPINICPWYFQENLAPKFVLESEPFKKSLSTCCGIFTLSTHLAKFVTSNLYGEVPVQCILHPTEIPESQFDFEGYLQERKVVQLGAWMRRLTSFFKLKPNKFKKYLPLNSITQRYLSNEVVFFKNLTADDAASVNIVQHLSNESYDQLLTESVVFLDLFDSSANNAIIECIARNTPIVVNPLPAVVEYLGESYPLYYNSLGEAEDLLMDDNKIFSGYNYLKNKLDKSYVKGETFLNSFFNSAAFKV